MSVEADILPTSRLTGVENSGTTPLQSPSFASRIRAKVSDFIHDEGEIFEYDRARNLIVDGFAETDGGTSLLSEARSRTGRRTSRLTSDGRRLAHDLLTSFDIDYTADYGYGAYKLNEYLKELRKDLLSDPALTINRNALHRVFSSTRMQSWQAYQKSQREVQSSKEPVVEIDPIHQVDVPRPQIGLSRRQLLTGFAGLGVVAAVPVVYEAAIKFVPDARDVFSQQVIPQLRLLVTDGIEDGKQIVREALPKIRPYAEQVVEMGAPYVNDSVGEMARQAYDRLHLVAPTAETQEAGEVFLHPDGISAELPPQKVEDYQDDPINQELLRDGIIDLFNQGRVIFEGDPPVIWSREVAERSRQVGVSLVAWLASNASGSVDELNPEDHRQGSLYRPIDIAFQLVTYAEKKGALADVCKSCTDPKQQWERFVKRRGHIWYEQVLAESQIPTRAITNEADIYHVPISKSAESTVHDYLVNRLADEDVADPAFDILVKWIAESRSGLAKVEKRDNGSVINFDSRIELFVHNCIERANSGELSPGVLYYNVTVDTPPAINNDQGSNEGSRQTTFVDKKVSVVPQNGKGRLRYGFGKVREKILTTLAASGVASVGGLIYQHKRVVHQPDVVLPSSAEDVQSPGPTRRGFLRLGAGVVGAGALAYTAALAPGAIEQARHMVGSWDERFHDISDQAVGELQSRFTQLLQPTRYSRHMVDRSGKVLRTLHLDADDNTDGGIVRLPTSLEDLSPSVIVALVACEDQSFFEHSGIDTEATARALEALFIHDGDVTQGASTITQQLVRAKAWSDDEREAQLTDTDARWQRKVTEMALSTLYEEYLERQLGSKEKAKMQILKEYFDNVYFGRNAYSLEAASHAYYDKSARDLNFGEAALLIGLIQQPAMFSKDSDAALSRRNYVLSRMLEEGGLIRSDYDASIQLPLGWIEDERNLFKGMEGTTRFASSQALKELKEAGVVADRDIRLTIDHDLQVKARERLREQIADIERRFGIVGLNGVLMVVNAETGEILVDLGGIHDSVYERDKEAAEMDLTQAPISPGSTTKPIAALVAVERGLMRDSKVIDEPVVLENADGTRIKILNWDEEEVTREVPFSEALASSYNTVAVSNAQVDGAVLLADIYKRMGISGFRDVVDKRPDRYSPTMVIGGGLEVTPFELATAYATLANGGNRVRLHTAKASDGRQVKTSGVRVVSKETVDEITAMLSDKESRLPGYGKSSPVMQFSDGVAVKTGTAQGAEKETVRNLVCAAYNPTTKLVVVAAMFDPDGKTLIPDKKGNRVTAGQYLAPVLVDVMKELESFEVGYWESTQLEAKAA